MSPGPSARIEGARRDGDRPGRAASAALFAALGDPTRLAVVGRLSREGPLSLTRLASRSDVTRQAIRKHLDVLERAGLVEASWRGRESLWELQPRALEVARRYLDAVSTRWDRALERLRAVVEE